MSIIFAFLLVLADRPLQEHIMSHLSRNDHHLMASIVTEPFGMRSKSGQLIT